MVQFKPEKINLSSINGGNEWQVGQSPTLETFNAPIKAAAWAQALATNSPNNTEANQEGIPFVGIETTADGTPRLVFKNLKGATPLIIDEVLSVSTTHDNIVVGYTNSIDQGSLNKTPSVGEESLVHIKTSDNYVYSALIKITGTVNSSGYYPFEVVEVLLLHNASVDRAVEIETLLYKKPVYHLNMSIEEATTSDFFMQSSWFNRDPKQGETFQVVGQDQNGNVYLLTFEITSAGDFSNAILQAYVLLSTSGGTKFYKHRIISGDFVQSGDTSLYIISPSATPLTAGTEIGLQIFNAQTKLYVVDVISFSQVLSVSMPYTVFYLNESGTITSKELGVSIVDEVTEII